MSHSPYIPFYPSDWLAGTRGLTAAETGIYITLIAMMYEREAPIPNDTRRLAKLCSVSPRRFKKIVADLIGLGIVVAKDNALSAPIIDRWEVFARREMVRPSVPAAIAMEVWARDGHQCRYCGDLGGPFDLDHVVPWSKGGNHSAENLAVACQTCNRSKGARTPQEWLGSVQ